MHVKMTLQPKEKINLKKFHLKIKSEFPVLFSFFLLSQRSYTSFLQVCILTIMWDQVVAATPTKVTGLSDWPEASPFPIAFQCCIFIRCIFISTALCFSFFYLLFVEVKDITTCLPCKKEKKVSCTWIASLIYHIRQPSTSM